MQMNLDNVAGNVHPSLTARKTLHRTPTSCGESLQPEGPLPRPSFFSITSAHSPQNSCSTKWPGGSSSTRLFHSDLEIVVQHDRNDSFQSPSLVSRKNSPSLNSEADGDQRLPPRYRSHPSCSGLLKIPADAAIPSPANFGHPSDSVR